MIYPCDKISIENIRQGSFVKLLLKRNIDEILRYYFNNYLNDTTLKIFQVTEEDVKRFYQPYGEIKEINLLRHSDGKLVGCGFVQFKHVEDASKAIFNTNKKEFFGNYTKFFFSIFNGNYSSIYILMCYNFINIYICKSLSLGRIINSDWAISKSKFCKRLEANLVGDRGIGETSISVDSHEKNKETNNAVRKEKDTLKKQKRRKFQKMKKQKRRARIVIRNLSFQVIISYIMETVF